MANSNVVNLYPVPTEGTTMERLTVDDASGATGDSFQTTYSDLTKYIVLDVQTADVFVSYTGSPTSTLGHRLYAGRSYTWSKKAAQAAKFIKTGSTDAHIHATEFTQ